MNYKKCLRCNEMIVFNKNKVISKTKCIYHPGPFRIEFSVYKGYYSKYFECCNGVQEGTRPIYIECIGCKSDNNHVFDDDLDLDKINIS